jgi:cation-transporting P-type ATPase 13A2
LLIIFVVSPPAALLMVCIVSLTLLSAWVLLAPPHPLVVILELMPLPFSGRSTILAAVAVNVVFSVAFERFGTWIVAVCIGWLMRLIRRTRRRSREGKTYKAVEGGMRANL